ncbi:mediator of RNA polymerase II transcription subunit 1-domain-containing protein [Lipomyces japonicus]|uniref:mediator of RNA polymerase II transcription subunit 1-domain-containing protein n=1 Tax=Lipomyces japonicus TaxID=56871 RepID=UPI0034CD3C59
MSDSPFGFKIPSSNEVTPFATPDIVNIVASSEPLSELQSASPSSFEAAVNAATNATFNVGRPHSGSPLRNTIDLVNGGSDHGASNRQDTDQIAVFGRPKSDGSRKRDIDAVIDILRTRPGAITEAGIERLAKNNGLEVFKEDIEGGKRISLGGRIILIDIDLRIPEHKAVKVAFSSASSMIDHSGGDAQAAAAIKGAILLEDLQTPALDVFARNLERLARHDRLSTSEIDNFQILQGVFEHGLKRVYDSEVARGIDAENEGSGRPVVDDAGVIGVSVWYWNERRKIANVPDRKKYKVVVEIDEHGRSGGMEWGVLQNNDWISVSKKEGQLDGHDNNVVEWNEPDRSNIEEQNTGFVLKLEPAIQVPYYDAAILDPEDEDAREDLVVKPTGHDDYSNNGVRYARRTIYDADGQPVQYRFRLSSAEDCEQRVIERVYIAHPRQLKTVLDILRQAVVASMLLDSAGRDTKSQPSPEAAKIGLADVLKAAAVGSSRGHESADTEVTVTVARPYGQAPRLGVIVPTEGSLASFVIEIGRAGVITVSQVATETYNSKSEQDQEQDQQAASKQLARVATISEDLGIVSHWIRKYRHTIDK